MISALTAYDTGKSQASDTGVGVGVTDRGLTGSHVAADLQMADTTVWSTLVAENIARDRDTDDDEGTRDRRRRARHAENSELLARDAVLTDWLVG